MTLTCSRLRFALLAIAAVMTCSQAGAQSTPALEVAQAAESGSAELQRLERRVAALDARTAQTEAVRAVRALQHAYGHYAEFGMWSDIADLFSTDAVAHLGDRTLEGRDAIRGFLVDSLGGGSAGIAHGQLNTELMMAPVVTLDPSGTLARGRWHRVALEGDGDGAAWSGGIFENEYVLEDGTWRIAKLHYYPQFAGPYESGWRNVNEETPEDVKPVPFHYDVDGAGTPIPRLDDALTNDARRRLDAQLEGAASRLEALGAQFVAVERRIADLGDEGLVRNLQHAYGYYVDRQMWDDVADLFASDATLMLGSRGTYSGRERIRAALETLGSAGLQPGELNDHLQLQTIVTIGADGRSANARGTELTMTGEHGLRGELGVNVFENTFVKEGGVWKIAAMRVYPRMRTDYAKGWAEEALPAPAASTRVPPDEPATATAIYPDVAVPQFHYAHPVTGNVPRYPQGMARVGDAPAGNGSRSPRLEPAPRTPDALNARLDEAERRLAVARAHDGAENISNAYGYYIDEFLWHHMADVFSEDGWKELSYIGTYVGRERIRESVIRRYTNVGRRPNALVIHQKTQPVIHVADDGRSAQIRTRLFQMNSSYANPGSWLSGIYENEVVLEDGVWKISAMDLDYTWTAGYDVGWAHVENSAARRFAPTSGGLAEEYPPDRPLTGAVFPPYPDVEDMRFHYANPVTGYDPGML